MKVERVDGRQEGSVLTGMIVHNRVLAKVAPKWEKDGLFGSPWANKVGSWCVKYHKKYGKAPGKNVQNLFDSWAEDNKHDKDTVKLVERFLGSLSNRYSAKKKEVNPDFVIDQASDLFNKVKANNLVSVIQGDIDSGKAKDVWDRLTKIKKVELGLGSFNDLDDESVYEEAFRYKPESLVKYPGALGKFFGDSLGRDNFVAFLGPMKRGKTFWTIDLAWRAMLQDKKVAYFQAGDLTRNQMMLRLGARASRRPIKPQTVRIPIGMEEVEGRVYPGVGFEEKEFKTGLSAEAAYQAVKKVGKGKNFRLSVYSTNTLSVENLHHTLDDWANDGWMADVVVVDYADILAPPVGYKESRDGVNHNWKALRRMSQEFHNLVVTATQANAKSFTAEILNMEHFSEDNRKFAHVTGMVGINQTNDEKKEQLQSLNWLVLREDEFDITKTVYAANCLAIANPAVKSIFL
jgi:hypothetical protein